MGLDSSRHDRALQAARQKIFQSGLASHARELYLYGSAARGDLKWDSDIDLLLVLELAARSMRGIRREIVCLKGSIAGDGMDAPEIDLKVVFGDAWKESKQAYYSNILREGRKIWQKD